MNIRTATPEDAATIHGFVTELAEYEHSADKVELTATDYEKFLREGGHFNALLAENDEGQAVGTAIWYKRFSTWVGDYIHLEDIYVKPETRGQGTGKQLIKHLAEIALSLDMKRMEWLVLKWNEGPIAMYESIGAPIAPDWRLCGMDEAALKNLVSNQPPPARKVYCFHDQQCE